MTGGFMLLVPHSIFVPHQSGIAGEKRKRRKGVSVKGTPYSRVHQVLGVQRNANLVILTNRSGQGYFLFDLRTFLLDTA